MADACIVLPVYNNPLTIAEVAEAALKTGAEVIVVDDGSTPPVALEAAERLHLLRHDQNSGKGAAILTGAHKAKALGYAHFFAVDTDGQHFPADIGRFAGKAMAQKIVIGCRSFGENVPGSSVFGRKFSNFWLKVETGLRLSDTQSGFRSYPVSITDLPVRSRRYDFEIEVLVLHAWRGGEIDEVEIGVYYPDPSERVSHFDKFRDNVRLSLLHTKLVTRRLLGLV